MKVSRLIFALLLLLAATVLLVACNGDPTVSPIATPTMEDGTPSPSSTPDPDLPPPTPETADDSGVDGDGDDGVGIPPFHTVLTMLSVGAVGGVLAFLAEHWPWFQNLPSERRFYVVIGLCIGLPILAGAMLDFIPPAWWPIIERWWLRIAAGFLAFLASQVAHRFDGVMKEGARLLAVRYLAHPKIAHVDGGEVLATDVLPAEELP